MLVIVFPAVSGAELSHTSCHSLSFTLHLSCCFYQSLPSSFLFKKPQRGCFSGNIDDMSSDLILKCSVFEGVNQAAETCDVADHAHALGLLKARLDAFLWHHAAPQPPSPTFLSSFLSTSGPPLFTPIIPAMPEPSGSGSEVQIQSSFLSPSSQTFFQC